MRSRTLLIFSPLLALSACEDWQPSRSSPSPDGKTIAHVEVSLAGAPADNRTRIVISNGSGGTLPKPVDVVEADNAIVGRTRVRWTDDTHLEVALCNATSFHVIAENRREPSYIDSGRTDGVGLQNAVWVDVMNLTYSDKKRACLPRSEPS
jgi:hypothetical protein